MIQVHKLVCENSAFLLKVGQCRPVCGHGLISWRQEADVSDTLSRVTVQCCASELSEFN
jgi:hypothetical protein